MDLLSAMRLAVDGSGLSGRAGVAFSGGVDSSLLARLCGEASCEITLLTVGFAGSHDLESAGRAAGTLGMPHHTHIIDPDDFGSVARRVCSGLQTDSISWQENGIAFHYISRMASGLGLGAVVTANGIDELFCGYDVYRRIYHRGRGAVQSMILQKTANEISMMQAVGRVSAENDIRMVQPLLGREFVEYSREVPLWDKIRGADDYLRKHAVRRAARLAGLPPEICYKPKKALQYGTRIHRNLLRTGIPTRA